MSKSEMVDGILKAYGHQLARFIDGHMTAKECANKRGEAVKAILDIFPDQKPG